ncbi:hypothetical protein FF1_021524 [Malus domestica]
MATYQSLKMDQKNPKSSVFYLQLNRPSHRNALSRDFFTEFPEALSSLDQDPNVNVIVLTGAGDHFCAGIYPKTLTSISDKFASGD